MWDQYSYPNLFATVTQFHGNSGGWRPRPGKPAGWGRLQAQPLGTYGMLTAHAQDQAIFLTFLKLFNTLNI